MAGEKDFVFGTHSVLESLRSNKEIDKILWKWNEEKTSVDSLGNEIGLLVVKVEQKYQEALEELHIEVQRLKSATVKVE